jgi:hypothetical protein
MNKASKLVKLRHVSKKKERPNRESKHGKETELKWLALKHYKVIKVTKERITAVVIFR